MPREIITLQVGQCGNQVGCRFWTLALREHIAYGSHLGHADDAASSFFHLSDTQDSSAQEHRAFNGQNVKARAVLIDMEEGVVNDLLKGPLSRIFDRRQNITNVSGSGNNWAHGHELHAQHHGAEILEKVRREAEACESLQSFFLLHSLGGGTGSGVGSFILEQLQDSFPEVYRFTASIFPSEDDDVVTSPYNSLLSLQSLTESADCVLPIENQALLDICRRANGAQAKASGQSGLPQAAATSAFPSSANKKSKQKPFDDMNDIAANMLLHLTSSVRFEGPLNVDLNDIIMNLMPFPRLHFINSSLSPILLPSPAGPASHEPRTFDQAFFDVLSRTHQLTTQHPLQSTYLACALMIRGQNVSISDINHNIVRMKQRMKMVPWNMDAFKIGICLQPPLGRPNALLCLANNCGMGSMFANMRERFMKLYSRKVFAHHYTQFMDEAIFQHSLETVDDLIGAYQDMDANTTPLKRLTRVTPIVSSFG